MGAQRQLTAATAYGQVDMHSNVIAIAFLSFAAAIAKGCDDNGPLGMASGVIEDWQIASSSSYPQEWDAGCHERYARLYRENGLGWCAKYKSSSEWLRIDLGVPATVTGVLLQGRGDGAEWVTSYLLSYSLDGHHWTYAADQHGKTRAFPGNKDSHSIQHSYLDSPVYARFIKIHTHTWNKHPSMRVELLGCQVARQYLGLPPYGKLSASSAQPFRRFSSCQPDDGHILSNKAWCAKDDNAEPWLQLDIGPPTLVTGVVTKGRGDTGRKQWVTRYRLSYTNDSESQWHVYKDEVNLEQKYMPQYYKENGSHIYAALPNVVAADGALEFGGNVDKDTPRYHYLTVPIVARFLRFHVVGFHQAPSMRVGILGRPHTGPCGPGFTRVNAESPCVENIAFKKVTWLNNRRHMKRHLGKDGVEPDLQAYDKLAAKAVDGVADGGIKACTILDNYYDDEPQLTIDLGGRRSVAGVIMLTWQEDSKEAREAYDGDYALTLDSLSVYTSLTSAVEQPELLAEEELCGRVTNENNGLLQRRLHVPCASRAQARYLRIQAHGRADRWSRWFAAVLCEVMVYE